MEEKKWFLYVVDHHEGPFTISEIKDLLKKGDAKTSSYVWKEGFQDWVMMSEVPEIGVSNPSGEGHGPAGFVIGGKESPVIFSPRSADVSSPQPSVHLGSGGAAAPDIANLADTAVVWCLNSNRSFSGPHSLRTIVRMINEGKASPNDTIWKEGWSGFFAISSFPEFMMRVHATPQGTQSKNKQKISGAAALGLMGSNVKKRRSVSFSGLIKLIMLLALVFGALYQVTAMGLLDPAYKKVGILDKIKQADLKPISLPKNVVGIEFLSDGWQSVKRKIEPLLAQHADKIPEPIRKFLSVVHLPENVSPNDQDRLREAATADPKEGTRAAAAVIGRELLNPRFVVTANLIDGSSLQFILRGKEGTLLNASDYVSEQVATLRDKVSISQPFYYEDTRALPQGEYTFSVLSEGQSILVESVFLGGPNDEVYRERLREFNERIAAWKASKSQEIMQIVATLENIANESATKFFKMSKMRAGTARANEWRKYSVKYQKLSDQLGVAIDRISTEMSATSLKSLGNSLKEGYNISDQLHRAQSEFFAASVASPSQELMTHVRSLAASLVSKLNGIKSELLGKKN